MVTEKEFRMKQLVAAMLSVLFVTGCCCLKPKSCCMVKKADSDLTALMDKSLDWQKVHAVEEFIAAGIIRPEFISTYRAIYDKTTPKTPPRVGACRVLYRCCPEERPRLRDELVAMAMDMGCPGDGHSIETMCKLNIKLTPAEMASLRRYTLGDNDGKGAMANYLLYINGDKEAEKSVLKAIENLDGITVYCFWFNETEISPEMKAALLKAKNHEGNTAEFQSFVDRACLLKVAGSHADCAELFAKAKKYDQKENWEGPVRFYMMALGDVATKDDFPEIAKWLSHENEEVRIAAAGSIVRIANTNK
jgi:hypothetical protein